ncbi:MAG: AraC family transcriptional regulator [Pseudomonadota bacterium]|nr:AraC family transcriptional regulator [Pseudomonadota bacterium]
MITRFRSGLTDRSANFHTLCRQCLSRQVPLLAVFADADHGKAGLFSAGFADYISYPFIAPEIERRLAACHGRPGGHMPSGLTEKPVEGLRLNTGSGLPPDRMQDLVDRACDRLLGDIQAPLTLDELAHVLGTNRNVLTRAFNQVLGCSTFQWLRGQRLARAAELLRHTDLSVQTIAFDVGYGEPANFATAFRRAHGCSPRQYRRNVRTSK